MAQQSGTLKPGDLILAAQQQFKKVNPGDLITAYDMNNILKRLELLEIRVAALEAVGPSHGSVVITELVPSAVPLRIGQELQVLGQNFGVSAGTCVVLIDNVLVTAYESGSNDQKLIFKIPDISEPMVPSTGRAALLIVGNGTSTAQRNIILLPAQPLQGAIDVIWLNVNPTTINSGSIATFRFRLRSRTNLNATYIINPVISVSGNQQQWQSNLQVLDNAQAEIGSKKITLATGEEKVFHVRINPVPAGIADNTPFILSVNASAETVTGTSGPINVILGTPIEQPDLDVSLNYEAADFDPVSSGSIEHGDIQDTIRLNSGSTAMITLLAEFRAVGTYQVLVEPVSDTIVATANWNLRRHPQSTLDEYTITEANLQNEQNKKNQVLDFLISPLAGASATGKVKFKIRRRGPNTSRELLMGLALNP